MDDNMLPGNFREDVLALHPEAVCSVARRGLIGFEIVEPQQREVNGHKGPWVTHRLGYGKTKELAWANAETYEVRARPNGDTDAPQVPWCAVRGWGEAEQVLADDRWCPSEGDEADEFPTPEEAIATGRLVPFNLAQLAAFAEQQEEGSP